MICTFCKGPVCFHGIPYVFPYNAENNRGMSGNITVLAKHTYFNPLNPRYLQNYEVFPNFGATMIDTKPENYGFRKFEMPRMREDALWEA